MILDWRGILILVHMILLLAAKISKFVERRLTLGKCIDFCPIFKHGQDRGTKKSFIHLISEIYHLWWPPDSTTIIPQVKVIDNHFLGAVNSKACDIQKLIVEIITVDTCCSDDSAPHNDSNICSAQYK